MTTHARRYEELMLHDHAGARWLAAIVTPIALTILSGIVMLAYPHL